MNTTAKIPSAEINYNAGNPFLEAKDTTEKREILKNASQKAKEIQRKLQNMGKEPPKVNDLLLMGYSQRIEQETGEKPEFHSYKGWAELGKKVRKGAKGFCIWSKPIKRKESEEREAQKEKMQKEGLSPFEDEKKFFHIAFLFSSLQVEKID